MTDREQKTLSFLKERLGGCRYFREHPADGAYRLEHSIRVARIGAQIARAEGMDEEHMAIACLLHDVAYGMDFPADYNWNDHGRDGARIARPFLATLGLDGQAVEDICYAIAIHVDDKADFAGRLTPFTQTVGDADNIDRFDAFRIYDTLRFRQFYDLPLTERLDWLGGLLPRLEELERMELATPTATALWREKAAFQKTFFERLLAQMKAGCLPEGMEEL